MKSRKRFLNRNHEMSKVASMYITTTKKATFLTHPQKTTVEPAIPLFFRATRLRIIWTTPDKRLSLLSS